MMDWTRLLSADRLGGKPAKPFDGRSPFLSDHDKIIFSQAFRRLGRKTQVHPLATNDHIHNRMTHSLEVACIGRSLATRVGKTLKSNGWLPEGQSPFYLGDIVQSTCLAHDIGNPPFGHTGEAAIGKWFRQHQDNYLQGLSPREQQDFLQFEGNAQGFRLLTAAATKPDSSIMSMTYGVLAAFIKYPFASNSAQARQLDKFGVFASEQPLLEEVAERTGLILQGDEYCRHPLVYLMEAADDFCYSLLDLEDGLEMKLVDLGEIMAIFSPLLSTPQKRWLANKCKAAKEGRAPSMLRGYIMDLYIDAAAETFVAQEQALLSGTFKGDLIEATGGAVEASVKLAKTIAKDKIFTHPRKVELEIGAYAVIYQLLDKVIPAVVDWYKGGGQSGDREHDMVIRLIGQENLPEIGSYYDCLMAGIDFVSGMTDNFASSLSQRFQGL